MYNISHLLEKFSKKITSDEDIKKTIIEIIKKNTGLDIPIKVLEIKNYIIYVQTSSAFKNKIFISKKAILDDIEKLSSIKIVDVR